MAITNKQLARPQYFQIGEMRKVGTFLRNNPVANSSGGQDDNYVDIATVRGQLIKQSGRKAFEQGEFVNNKNYEWYCRYSINIVVDTDTILVIDGLQYRIADYEFIDEIKHFYKFTLSLNR